MYFSKPTYTGESQLKLGESISNTKEVIYPYIPSKELANAVNLSIFLNRPLLLKGEPGCGKTRLAYDVAQELRIDIYPWYVKSTSRAQDGLYTYDTVGRLRDAQLASTGILDIDKLKPPADYIKWGPVGKAFQSASRSVLLIDEIDKADIDFPNDLLRELDQKQFSVDEIDKTVSAKSKPIVIITSNDEKDLSDAFLRRCIFHYLEFPGRERLFNIVNCWFPDSPAFLVQRAVERFCLLRKEMESQKGDSGKKVSTSELIDWFRVLNESSEEEAIRALQEDLPYPELLLKSREDQENYKRSYE